MTEAGRDASAPARSTTPVALSFPASAEAGATMSRCVARVSGSTNSTPPTCRPAWASASRSWHPSRSRGRLRTPYKDVYPDSHGHFTPTRFVQQAYSAACVPFRWMLREQVEGSATKGEIGIAERLKIGWVPDREPNIHNRQGNEVETGLGPTAGEPARAARHLLRRAPARGIALLLLCQAHSALGAVATRDRRRWPRALRRRGH